MFNDFILAALIKKLDTNLNTYRIKIGVRLWQGQKDLNPRHAVLETAALPTELYPYVKFCLIILPFPGDVVNGVSQKN